VAWWLCSCAAVAALLGLGASFGLWFCPFVAGLLAGASSWRVRAALGWVVLAVCAGWGVTLWWPALSGAPAGATARVVAALAGLPPFAAAGVAGTLLVGILQGAVALWLARALAGPLHGRRPAP
jgi:branched-subunit amino acid transport protein